MWASFWGTRPFRSWFVIVLFVVIRAFGEDEANRSFGVCVRACVVCNLDPRGRLDIRIVRYKCNLMRGARGRVSCCCEDVGVGGRSEWICEVFVRK